MLWEASDHVSDPAKKNPPVLSDFLLEVEKKLPADDSILCVALMQSDQPVSYRGRRPERLVFHTAETVDQWLDQKAPQELFSAILRFTKTYTSQTEPILWQREVLLADDGNSSASSTVVPEQKPAGQSVGAIEAALLDALGKNQPLSENEIRCAMIPVVLDRDGMHYSVVTSEREFPTSDAFGFSSKEAFMRGFNQMKGPMLDLRDKAAKRGTEMFIDSEKKYIKNCGNP